MRGRKTYIQGLKGCPAEIVLHVRMRYTADMFERGAGREKLHIEFRVLSKSAGRKDLFGKERPSTPYFVSGRSWARGTLLFDVLPFHSRKRSRQQ